MAADTPQLSLRRPDAGTKPWTTDWHISMDRVDIKFDPTSGHDHSGTTGNSKKLPVSSIDASLVLTSTLTTHFTAADHDARYARLAGATFTGAVALPAGTEPLPSLTMGADPDTGFYYGGSGRWFFSRNNQRQVGLGGNGLLIGHVYSLDWSVGEIGSGVTIDLRLQKDASNVLGLRNGGTVAAPVRNALQIWKFDDSAVPAYERAFIGWSGDEFYVTTQHSGTGAVARNMYIGPTGAAELHWRANGASSWYLDTSRNILPGANDSYDIGSGSRVGVAVSRDPRYIYARRALIINGNNGNQLNIQWKSQEVTIAAAGFTDSTITIDANTQVIGVQAFVTVSIPGTATFNLGTPALATQYGTGISSSAGGFTSGMLAGILPYSAATAIRISPNAVPSGATGKVRITIFYLAMVIADS